MIVLHTSAGDITLKLDHDKAPISAANFVEYARPAITTARFSTV